MKKIFKCESCNLISEYTEEMQAHEKKCSRRLELPSLEKIPSLFTKGQYFNLIGIRNDQFQRLCAGSGNVKALIVLLAAVGISLDNLIEEKLKEMLD